LAPKKKRTNKERKGERRNDAFCFVAELWNHLRNILEK